MGTFLIGASLERSTRAATASRPVNRGAADPRDISANNSPSLSRNPLDRANLAVANRIDTPSFSCALNVSFDDGATWAPTAIPFPAGEEAPPRCFAPDVAFGADGTLYASFVTLKGLGNTPNAAWTVSSRDGGRSLSSPAKAVGPLTFQVRLVADPLQPNRLYLSWLQASATATLGFPSVGNPINLARSDDGGASWSTPVRVSAPARQRVVAPSAAVGPRGELYVSYLHLGQDSLDYAGAHEGKGGEPYPGRWSLVLARSTDQGVSWQETVVDQQLVPTERFIVFFPPSPSMAVDARGGNVYVGFADGRRGDADVWVWASKDGGASFAAPTLVSEGTTAGTSQYLPKLAVAPDGRLDVVYYDRRSDPNNVMNEVSLQSSSDGAKTFGPRLRVSDAAFDSRIGFGSERGLPDLGSRLGLVSSERRALAVWADTRAGTEASNKQDLASATVSFPESSPLGQPLRYGGLVVAGVGVLVLLSWPRWRN
ncbi:MAG TPA: sialidase family protein [Acidimicrobiales bacterium]|nr:sialidase family protein [Acidimicrobiales bacterium]